jgi:hypothetical protein
MVEEFCITHAWCVRKSLLCIHELVRALLYKVRSLNSNEVLNLALLIKIIIISKIACNIVFCLLNESLRISNFMILVAISYFRS